MVPSMEAPIRLWVSALSPTGRIVQGKACALATSCRCSTSIFCVHFPVSRQTVLGAMAICPTSSKISAACSKGTTPLSRTANLATPSLQARSLNPSC